MTKYQKINLLEGRLIKLIASEVSVHAFLAFVLGAIVSPQHHVRRQRKTTHLMVAREQTESTWHQGLNIIFKYTLPVA